MHSVARAQNAVEVVSFGRATSWQERRFTQIGALLPLPALGVTSTIADLYRATALAPR